MARSYASWDSFAGVMTALAWAADPDLSELCVELGDVIADDNRRGVLAGLDRDGSPMPATLRQLRGAGDQGPPLAPRGDASRVIANLRTGWERQGPGEWVAWGEWLNVLSDRGVSFLPFHFRGEGRLPTRDLAGLRPEGLEDAQSVVSAWVEAQINAKFQEVS